MPETEYPTCACGQRLTGRQRAWCSTVCREQHRDPRARKPGSRRKSKAPRRFAGVDGESIDGRFILLAAASDDGWSQRVENVDGLSTRQCLIFLTSLPKSFQYWGFAFGYDVNMMLRDLSLGHVTRLYETGQVYWREFRIAYTPGKKLTVSRYPSSRKGQKPIATSTVWDAFTWIQSSFASWLDAWSLCTPREVARIRAMKDQRATFDVSQRAAIRRYCISECRYLAAGARRLVTLIDDAGIRVSTYYSPASVSKALLRTNNVTDFRAEPPDAILSAVDAAYMGGRAEVSEVGPVEGPFYQHDIRSAYPAAAVSLPCLACGTWTQRKPATSVDNVRPWDLCRVSWRPKPGKPAPIWGALPVRPRTGSLRWPTHGTGWFWGVEVLAADRHCTIEVKDRWRFHVGCDHRPFDYLRDLYAQRVALKLDGDPTEFVLKLALNATYGALAEHPHRAQKSPPKYRSLAWAGWITAATRARLLDALDDDVVLMATDCVVSRKPLGVKLGDALGEWELKTYDRLWIAGTGIYYGERDGAWSTTKTRGFEAGQLTRETLAALWERDGRTGHVRLFRHRFIGMGTALHRIHGFWPPYARLWRTFIVEPCDKSLDLAPRRTWLHDGAHDGRTRAPSLADHRATEKRDRERLARLRVEREALRVRIEHAQAVLAEPVRVSTSAKVNRRRSLTRAAAEMLTSDESLTRLLLLNAQVESAEDGLSSMLSWSDDPQAGA